MQQRVVVVTGGFGALGQVVAQAARQAGAKVALIGRGVAPPGQHCNHAEAGVDLSDAAQAERVMAEIAAHLGRIDALLNIAGGFRAASLARGGAETWEAMFRSNVLTAVGASAAALPHLSAPGGAIVNVASAAASRAGSGMGAYAASKAAVLRLTESLAEEQKGRGVRINAVSLTTIDTPDNRKAMPDADFGAWVTAEELARVILFLASDAASGVTGADVRVGGGT